MNEQSESMPAARAPASRTAMGSGGASPRAGMDSARTITHMLHRYCELFDTGDFDGFARQFARGQWFRAEPGEAATRRWIEDHVLTYDGRPGTQHLTTNVIVQVDEEAGTATASSYITVVQGVPGFPMQPIFGGRYKDRFERVDGEWVWRERKVLSDVRGDTSHHVRVHPTA